MIKDVRGSLVVHNMSYYFKLVTCWPWASSCCWGGSLRHTAQSFVQLPATRPDSGTLPLSSGNLLVLVHRRRRCLPDGSCNVGRRCLVDSGRPL